MLLLVCTNALGAENNSSVRGTRSCIGKLTTGDCMQKPAEQLSKGTAAAQSCCSRNLGPRDRYGIGEQYSNL